ncbi:MAG: putative glycoside hydrolase [Eubacteriales bacterium]|nr:putative glycoside hydrolase [Eubacteriales bacterium]
MRKKRFYNNKKRNTKWTEPEKGRKIDFADKYIDAGTGSDKFDSKRPKKRKKRFTAEKTGKFFKNAIVVLLCFCVVSAGYTIMDLYMERNAMPENNSNSQVESNIGSLSLNIKSRVVPSLSLDGGVMLDAVISDTQNQGYSSVTFDLKRNDGTIGYESKLATIDAYGAISSASTDLEGSVARLLESDLLPIARISCYKDNIAPVADLTAAVTNGASLYKDADGNTYLNPDSQTTYNYIKGIIEEAKGMGITVFVLDNTELPEDIGSNYKDGFAGLTKKLYADLGEEIKLLMAVDVDAVCDVVNNAVPDEDSEENAVALPEGDTEYVQSDEEFEKDLSQKIQRNAGTNAVYYITTNREDDLKSYLNGKDTANYIISVENEP